MSAAAFSNWVMLERFVFCRDDEKSFPDASKAITASGTTSWGATFDIAFYLNNPPQVSRIYARLPDFPNPNRLVPLLVLATHSHLALLRVGTETPARLLLQDFFIFNSADDNPSTRLAALSPCTLPYRVLHEDCRSSPQEKGAPEKRRLLVTNSLGILSRGAREFVVAELLLFKPSRCEVNADICWLRSRTSPGAGPTRLCGEWSSIRQPITLLGSNNRDDTWQLYCWETDTVIPFNRWLCWIDYCRGILFCDLFADPKPTVSFLCFPLGELPSTCIRWRMCSFCYRAATAVDDGHALKFVNVPAGDGVGYGSLKPGHGFTITCHTLRLGDNSSMVWDKDYTVTSDELWSANPGLPRSILMFPQVDIDEPHVVYFHIIEFEFVLKKMLVVSIDMKTKATVTIYPYINGEADRGTEDFDFTEGKSRSPKSFLPCEFPKFLHISRKRKDME